jgi:chromosome segregation ATPase
MSIENVVNAVDIATHKLPYMESLYGQVKDQTDRIQYIRQRLSNDIEALKYKLSILDKAALSSEQECWRTEQQLQELTAKKDRLEKWIANVSNNDDELKRLVKANVKAALSENKLVISVAFTALLQTLKNDPEMVNLVYSISSTNDDELHKDNSNNVTKYLESNKNSLSDLAEKYYENLVEALTNNAIATASSNPTLSLPPSSSIFQSPPNQSNIHKIEDPEDFHNGKGEE